jgi:hypothetical protein
MGPAAWRGVVAGEADIEAACLSERVAGGDDHGEMVPLASSLEDQVVEQERKDAAAWLHGLGVRSIVKHSDRVAIVTHSFGRDGHRYYTDTDVEEFDNYVSEVAFGSENTVQLRYEDGPSLTLSPCEAVGPCSLEWARRPFVEEYVKKAQLRRPSEEEAAAPWVVAWLEEEERWRVFHDRLKGFLQCVMLTVIGGSFVVFFVAPLFYAITMTVIGAFRDTSLDGMFSESDGRASGSA